MYKIGENYKYIFDSNGLNGASQRRPESDPSKYADIVRKYHRDFTEDEVKKCLHMLRTEGCGYAALVNTVFLRFFGEEEQYQKIFGYPMYTSDGKLNFDDLLVDFYCATDNHYGFFGFDLVDKKEDEKYEKGYGTTLESSEWRFETYMKKHGVSVDVRQIHVSPDNLMKYMEKGPVLVSVRPLTLYDREGNKTFESCEGHTMTVTGAIDKELIRVSSWGAEYYIKHGTYSAYENYQHVIYRN